MKHNPQYHSYRHYIDVSGLIGKEDIFIGNILINELYRDKFLKEFYDIFPNLRSFNKKGSSLNAEKLIQIITFMNEKRIRMTCLKFPKYKYNCTLKEAKEKIRTLLKEPDISFPRERIMSPLYFYALKEHSFKNYHYEGQVCAETQINIVKVLSKMGYIAKNNEYKFSMSINHRRNQHMLKFADFVASAGRKIDEFKLKQYNYYKIITPVIEDRDLKIAFGINKIESDKQKCLNNGKDY